jgi:hypothetical protein
MAACPEIDSIPRPPTGRNTAMTSYPQHLPRSADWVHPETAPDEILAADGETVLRRFRVVGVIYAQTRKIASARLSHCNIELEAARVLTADEDEALERTGHWPLTAEESDALAEADYEQRYQPTEGDRGGPTLAEAAAEEAAEEAATAARLGMSLRQYRASQAECCICVPGQCPGPECPGWQGTPELPPGPSAADVTFSTLSGHDRQFGTTPTLGES